MTTFCGYYQVEGGAPFGGIPPPLPPLAALVCLAAVLIPGHDCRRVFAPVPKDFFVREVVRGQEALNKLGRVVEAAALLRLNPDICAVYLGAVHGVLYIGFVLVNVEYDPGQPPCKGVVCEAVAGAYSGGYIPNLLVQQIESLDSGIDHHMPFAALAQVLKDGLRHAVLPGAEIPGIEQGADFIDEHQRVLGGVQNVLCGFQLNDLGTCWKVGDLEVGQDGNLGVAFAYLMRQDGHEGGLPLSEFSGKQVDAPPIEHFLAVEIAIKTLVIYSIA